MRVTIRWVNELQGTTEGELSGEWDRSIGTAIFDGAEAKLEINGKSVRFVADDHEERGYVWRQNDSEIVVHIPEA